MENVCNRDINDKCWPSNENCFRLGVILHLFVLLVRHSRAFISLLKFLNYYARCFRIPRRLHRHKSQGWILRENAHSSENFHVKKKWWNITHSILIIQVFTHIIAVTFLCSLGRWYHQTRNADFLFVLFHHIKRTCTRTSLMQPLGFCEIP